MTTPVEAHAAPGPAVDHPTAEHSDQPVAGLRFEKSELHEFLEEDRVAGEHVGVLLAVVFAVSLVLVSGVSYWTSLNQAQGHDPQNGVGAATTEHH